MKKSIVMIAAAIALTGSIRAQSPDEGIKMVKYERYTSAQKILEPLAAGNPLANYYLGLAQLGTDNIEAARATFSKFPDDPANMAGLSRIAFRSGNATEGLRIAMAVAEKAKKKDWQPLVYAADAINYEDGNPQQAVDLYKKALEKTDNADIRIGLGDAQQKLQNALSGGEAMTNYQKVTGKDPKNSLAYSRMGALWYGARNYKEAVTNYNLAKDADPNNPLPYRDLANAYYRVGKFDLANQNIDKYFELSDKDPEDKIQRANIKFMNKDYPTAIQQMQELMSQGVVKPYMYWVLGRSQYETKDYPNALQNMRTFFSKQDPKKVSPEDYLYYGKIFIQMKQGDSADYYFARYLETDTSEANKAKNYGELADLYKSLNTEAGYNKAADYYGKIVTAKGDKVQPIDHFWWGAMNYYAKKYDEAGRIFEGMESKFPNEPSGTYWRARVAAATDKEGKSGAAVPFFTKWLAIPNTDNYTKKPGDLTLAYEYLAIVAYNKNDKAAMKEYIAKLKEVNPTDGLIKQLEDYMNKPAGKPAGNTPKAPAPKPKKK